MRWPMNSSSMGVLRTGRPYGFAVASPLSILESDRRCVPGGVPSHSPAHEVFMPGTPLLAADRFFQAAMARLQKLLESQREALDRAATLCTEAIARDGLVHL